MFKNVRHWHEHKHARVLAIGQLRSQSATALSYATNSRPVAAHQCHELWFRTHVDKCLQRAFILVSRYVKDIKIHQDVPVMITNVLTRFFHILRVPYECEM